MSVDINDSLRLDKLNTPTREGERVEKLSDIQNIPTPSVGMGVFVEEEGREFVITALKDKVVAGTILKNAAVESYEMRALKSDIQGTSENSNPVTDPFKFLGEFDSYDKLNETLDTLTYSLGHQKGYGYFRARVGTVAIDIKSILVSSAQNAVGQVVQGMLTLNSNKKLTLANGTYKIYFRKHQNNAWGDWKDITAASSGGGSSSGNGDLDLSNYVRYEAFNQLHAKVNRGDKAFDELKNKVVTSVKIGETEYTPSVGVLELKTINNQSIVGSGNITITGDGGTIDLSEYVTQEEFQQLDDETYLGFTNVANRITELKYSDLNDLPTFKTINGNSILGSGDITVSGDGGTIDLSDYVKKSELEDVALSGRYDDLSGLPTIPTTLSQLTQSASYRTVTDTEKSTWGGKQDKLISGTNLKTINGESLLGSGDIAISNGGNGVSAYPKETHSSIYTNFTLTPNVFHVWGDMGTLTLTLGEETDGVANEYLFQFTGGSGGTTLVLPDSIKWANGTAPTIEAFKTYQISILEGLASFLVFN